MLAMQYTVRLPLNFSADQLRARVAQRAPLFDGLDGLIQKVFLFDAAENTYAALYLWRDHEVARQFLFQDLFAAVVATYGRPRVRLWSVLEFDRREDRPMPRFASWEIDKVTADEDLAGLLRRERERHLAALELPGLAGHTVAIDADRWEVSRFSLWQEGGGMQASDADCVYGYQVLHLTESHQRVTIR